MSTSRQQTKLRFLFLSTTPSRSVRARAFLSKSRHAAAFICKKLITSIWEQTNRGRKGNARKTLGNVYPPLLSNFGQLIELSLLFLSTTTSRSAKARAFSKEGRRHLDIAHFLLEKEQAQGISACYTETSFDHRDRILIVSLLPYRQGNMFAFPPEGMARKSRISS